MFWSTTCDLKQQQQLRFTPGNSSSQKSLVSKKDKNEIIIQNIFVSIDSAPPSSSSNSISPTRHRHSFTQSVSSPSLSNLKKVASFSSSSSSSSFDFLEKTPLRGNTTTNHQRSFLGNRTHSGCSSDASSTISSLEHPSLLLSTSKQQQTTTFKPRVLWKDEKDDETFDFEFANTPTSSSVASQATSDGRNESLLSYMNESLATSTSKNKLSNSSLSSSSTTNTGGTTNNNNNDESFHNVIMKLSKNTTINGSCILTLIYLDNDKEEEPVSTTTTNKKQTILKKEEQLFKLTSTTKASEREQYEKELIQCLKVNVSKTSCGGGGSNGEPKLSVNVPDLIMEEVNQERKNKQEQEQQNKSKGPFLDFFAQLVPKQKNSTIAKGKEQKQSNTNPYPTNTLEEDESTITHNKKKQKQLKLSKFDEIHVSPCQCALSLVGMRGATATPLRGSKTSSTTKAKVISSTMDGESMFFSMLSPSPTINTATPTKTLATIQDDGSTMIDSTISRGANTNNATSVFRFGISKFSSLFPNSERKVAQTATTPNSITRNMPTTTAAITNNNFNEDDERTLLLTNNEGKKKNDLDDNDMAVMVRTSSAIAATTSKEENEEEIVQKRRGSKRQVKDNNTNGNTSGRVQSISEIGAVRGDSTTTTNTKVIRSLKRWDYESVGYHEITVVRNREFNNEKKIEKGFLDWDAITIRCANHDELDLIVQSLKKSSCAVVVPFSSNPKEKLKRKRRKRVVRQLSGTICGVVTMSSTTTTTTMSSSKDAEKNTEESNSTTVGMKLISSLEAIDTAAIDADGRNSMKEKENEQQQQQQKQKYINDTIIEFQQSSSSSNGGSTADNDETMDTRRSKDEIKIKSCSDSSTVVMPSSSSETFNDGKHDNKAKKECGETTTKPEKNQFIKFIQGNNFVNKSMNNINKSIPWDFNFHKKKYCELCDLHFTLLTRRHHCRNCEKSCCSHCSSVLLVKGGGEKRYCNRCSADILQKQSEALNRRLRMRISETVLPGKVHPCCHRLGVGVIGKLPHWKNYVSFSSFTTSSSSADSLPAVGRLTVEVLEAMALPSVDMVKGIVDPYVRATITGYDRDLCWILREWLPNKRFSMCSGYCTSTVNPQWRGCGRKGGELLTLPVISTAGAVLRLEVLHYNVMTNARGKDSVLGLVEIPLSDLPNANMRQGGRAGGLGLDTLSMETSFDGYCDRWYRLLPSDHAKNDVIMLSKPIASPHSEKSLNKEKEPSGNNGIKSLEEIGKRIQGLCIAPVEWFASAIKLDLPARRPEAICEEHKARSTIHVRIKLNASHVGDLLSHAWFPPVKPRPSITPFDPQTILTRVLSIEKLTEPYRDICEYIAETIQWKHEAKVCLKAYCILATQIILFPYLLQIIHLYLIIFLSIRLRRMKANNNEEFNKDEDLLARHDIQRVNSVGSDHSSQSDQSSLPPPPPPPPTGVKDQYDFRSSPSLQELKKRDEDGSQRTKKPKNSTQDNAKSKKESSSDVEQDDDEEETARLNKAVSWLAKKLGDNKGLEVLQSQLTNFDRDIRNINSVWDGSNPLLTRASILCIFVSLVLHFIVKRRLLWLIGTSIWYFAQAPACILFARSSLGFWRGVAKTTRRQHLLDAEVLEVIGISKTASRHS